MKTKNKKKQPEYTYWKRSWQKWLVLALAVLELSAFIVDVGDYNNVVSAGIFSAEKLRLYEAQQKFSCSVNGLLFLSLLGVFFVGQLAKKKSTAMLAEAIIISLISLALALSLVIFRPASLWLWVLIAAAAAVCAVYSFVGYSRSLKE